MRSFTSSADPADDNATSRSNAAVAAIQTLQEAGRGDPFMSVANSIIVYSLLALAYLVTPLALLAVWIRWLKRTDARTPATTPSLISFALASSSALLAAFTLAQFHHFGFYEPVLMRIYGTGVVLSCLSAVLALFGLWRRNTLRWYAPACAVGTLAFGSWRLRASSCSSSLSELRCPRTSD